MRIVLVLLGLAAACTVEADNGGTSTPMQCIAGAVVACTCPDGAASSAICGADGFYGACMCAAATEPTSNAEASDASTETAGETGTADGSESTAGSSTGCDGTIYDGRVDDVPSLWSMGGQTGFAAGEAMCQAIGADHPCDYAEVRDAELAGELDSLTNISAWIHRTTIEAVEGVPSAASPGGRCVDWTTDSDLLADGEWVDFTSDGPIYHLDPDTFYDGLDGSHADPMALPCAATTRAVLCCNAPC